MDQYQCTLCHCTDSISARHCTSADVVRRYYERLKIDVSNYFVEPEFTLRQCCNCGLQSYFPSQCGDDSFYRQLQLSPQYYEKDKPEFCFARELLLEFKPKHVFEIGCGAGYFLRSVSQAYKVAGSETNSDAIAMLGDAGIDLDADGGKYDFILAFQVLEHISDVSQFLTGVVDKLERGGHLLLTVPNPEGVYSREVDDVLDYPPHHMTRWSMQALENITQFFPLSKVVDYYEPLRIEHYRSILVSRRQKVAGCGIYGRVMRRLGDCFDALYAPYSYGRCTEAGHTHGIFFVKN